MYSNGRGFSIQNVFFKNPFVIVAQPTPLSFPSGRVGPKLLMYYKRITSLEPAVVVVGPASVTAPRSRKYSLLRVDQPKYFDGIATLVKVITVNGSKAGIQLTYPAPVMNPLDWYRQPSLKSCSLSDFPPLSKMAQLFLKACSRCVEAGFCYIELDLSQMPGLRLIWTSGKKSFFKDLFTNCQQCVKEEAVFAIRVDSRIPDRTELLDLFLNHGGDLIVFDEVVLCDKVPPEKSCYVQTNVNHLSQLLNSRRKTCVTGVRPDTLLSLVSS